ncbi:MAG: VanW family protein [Armatimonadota bacterium]|nr:VanW family protein [Armatimonadota bacterium]
MRRKLVRTGLCIAALLSAAVLCAAAIVLSFQRSDHICRDVTVSGVRIGGLPRNQARVALERWADLQLKRRITLVALDSRWTSSLSDLGFSVSVDSLLDRAYRVGREGSVINRAVCVLTPWGLGKHISAGMRADEVVLRRVVRSLARRVDRPHKDARLKVVSGRLEVVPDECGIKLDIDKSVQIIKSRVALGAVSISLPVEADKPDVTAADASGITVPLASFTTFFNPAKVERTHNLRLAANAINGVIIKPGMVFSANDTIGPRLAARGFRPAQIFVRGKLEEGIGGGVCQVSSTLYNAVLLAGLKIIERSHHSRLVPYVGPGRDATVVYGLLDFKFQNTNSAPVAIISQVVGSRLTVAIYGSPADRKTVKVYASESRRIPAGSRVIEDPSLSPGVRKIIEKGSSGVSVTVYRKITFPDGKSITEIVSRDRYQPQDTVIAVGVGRGTQAQSVTSAAPALSHPDTGSRLE